MAALPELILASTSRYRQALLERLQLAFAVASPGVDEAHSSLEAPRARAERLALAKAMAVANQHPTAAVIGSDQVAECNGAILDKSGNAAAAAAQLRQLSGSEAVFYSAVAVVCTARSYRDTFVDVTRVRFRQLDEAAIARYIAAESPFDCAGSFRSESLGVALFESQQSIDPTGLIGLPLIRLSVSLRALGFALP